MKQEQFKSPEVQPSEVSGEDNYKTYENTVVLSFFFGMFGVDRFYLGRIGTGVAKLLTVGGLGIWYSIDLILIAFGKIHDSQGRPLKGSDEPHTLVKVMSVLCGVGTVISVLAYGVVMVFAILLIAASPSLFAPQASSPLVIERSDPERVFTLTLSDDGCGVVRDTPPGGEGMDINWAITDLDGFQMAGVNANGNTHLKWGLGKYKVQLESWGEKTGGVVAVSNTVEVDCHSDSLVEGVE